MDTTLRVRRFNSEAETSQSYWQEYTVEVENHSTVLDALIKIREDVDGTLALRCSCRASICGSCAMRINGRARLACKTKIVSVASSGEPVSVEPPGNMTVVKDLVANFEPFWAKVRAVQPYLQPEGPEPEDEYPASREAMAHLTGVVGCIMCGACVSDCSALAIDSNFLGPAALAKAYRFVGDPRDAADKERLQSLSEYSGIWDCTRCLECVQVCPKGVDPMGRIMALREKAVDAGYSSTYGARHTIAFAEIVQHSGHLDELKLPIKTFGMFNIPKLLGLLPTGLRALVRGKMPPIIHRPIPGVENIRRIFRIMEDKK